MTQTPSNVHIETSIIHAHIDGNTLFDWIPDTDKLITCGSEAEIRLWTTKSDEVQDSWAKNDPLYAIRSAKADKFFLALGNHQVQSFGIEEGEERESLIRFTSNPTCIDYHPDGDLLVAGGADFLIKLVELGTLKINSFEGHTGPILSVALDPMKKLIASSSCDGSIGCWSIETKSLVYHWLNVFPSSNDFDLSPVLARPAWQPKTGEVLAFPRAATVELYNRSQWTKPFRKVSHPRLVGPVSIIAFSNDGSLLAAAAGNTLLVWRFTSASSGDFEPRAVLNCASEARITDVRFQPNRVDEFGVCTSQGTLQLNKITSQNAEEIGHKKISQSREANNVGIDLDDFDDIYDNIPDEDFECISFEDPSDQANKVNNAGNHIDREVDDRFNAIKQRLEEANKKNKTHILPGEDDDNDGDIGRIKSQYEPMIFGNNEDSQEGSISRVAGGLVASKIADDIEIDGERVSAHQLLAAVRAPKYVPPTQQAAFQPGSTPVHHRQRFMVWNSVGIVYSHESEQSDVRSIDVEFHDNAFHHSIHLDNRLGYTMAALSSTALVLGSQEDASEEVDVLERDKSRLYCRLFATWDKINEWHLEMNKGEKIEAVAAGQTFVAAFTDALYVRVWTTGGIQTSILSVAGPPVTLAAHDRLLMILYHGAAQTPAAGQSIWTQVLKIDHKGKTRCHPIATPVQVALSPKSCVYWAGFSDEGTPAVVDSDGVVRMWKSHFGYSWLPICATKDHGKGKSDNFFIIGLSEIQAQVRCIYCKASRYPATVPKPTLTILPLAVPLVQSFSAKSKLENECFLGRWLASLLRKLSADGYEVEDTLETTEKKTIGSFIKLFALALAADRESLAMEIAGLLPNQSALEGAVRYAERQGHRSLATKLVEMIELEELGQTSGDDANNSDTELETFGARMNADRLARLLKEREEFAEDSNSMISLVRKETTTTSNSLKISNTSSLTGSNSRQRSVLVEDENDEEILRPVPFNVTNKNKRNPFAMGSKTKKKRRLEDDDQDGQDKVEEICPDENARDDFIQLDTQNDKDSKNNKIDNKTKMAANKKKKTTALEVEDTESVDGNNSNKSTSKITSFFKKN